MAKRNQHFLLPETPYRSYQDYLQDLGPFPKEKLNNPGAVLTEIAASGLRGRGGAGFPTGEKWRTIAAHPCKIHDIVCNAAEGEPGTFKDRFLIRYNPYPSIKG